MHLSPAALDSAIRLLDQPPILQKFGDMLETGMVSEGKVGRASEVRLRGGAATARHRAVARRNLPRAEADGGEAGIRTLDTAFRPYNGLANRRLQPLGHLTVTS